MRTTHRHCKICSGWHEIGHIPHNCQPEPIWTASSLPAPHFVTDSTEVRSMLDGRVYDSKSNLRRTYKAAGVEEIGNEAPGKVEKPKADRAGIREELRRVAAGFG